MRAPKDCIAITLQRAIELMGVFPKNCKGWEKSAGQSILLATNINPRCGYNIRLDDPSAKFFQVKPGLINGDSIIVIQVGNNEYSFDGLGWADETLSKAQAAKLKMKRAQR